MRLRRDMDDVRPHHEPHGMMGNMGFSHPMMGMQVGWMSLESVYFLHIDTTYAHLSNARPLGPAHCRLDHIYMHCNACLGIAASLKY